MTKIDVSFRRYAPSDHVALWAMLEPTFRSGETYAIDRDISKENALAYWTHADREVWVVESDGVLLGTYYVVRNQAGGGGHVCNCGFVTSPAARGRGIARSMLKHALKQAKSLGFAAMQFNFVLSSNSHAVKLWESEGFEIVGTLPKAFNHPTLGLIDALVMFRSL